MVFAPQQGPQDFAGGLQGVKKVHDLHGVLETERAQAGPAFGPVDQQQQHVQGPPPPPAARLAPQQRTELVDRIQAGAAGGDSQSRTGWPSSASRCCVNPHPRYPCRGLALPSACWPGRPASSLRPYRNAGAVGADVEPRRVGPGAWFGLNLPLLPGLGSLADPLHDALHLSRRDG